MIDEFHPSLNPHKNIDPSLFQLQSVDLTNTFIKNKATFKIFEKLEKMLEKVMVEFFCEIKVRDDIAAITHRRGK